MPEFNILSTPCTAGFWCTIRMKWFFSSTDTRFETLTVLFLRIPFFRDAAASQWQQFLMFQRAAWPLTSQYALACPAHPVTQRHIPEWIPQHKLVFVIIRQLMSWGAQMKATVLRQTALHWTFTLLLLQLPNAQLSGTTSTGWNIRKSYNWKELVLLYQAAYMMILPSNFIWKIGDSSIIAH